MMARGATGAAMALLIACASGCEEPVRPCDEYDRFALALEARCGTFAWDCEAVYPTLGPGAQQDLDWCLDCVRAREEGELDLPCDEAPLSGEGCDELLSRTLDASCLSST